MIALSSGLSALNAQARWSPASPPGYHATRSAGPRLPQPPHRRYVFGMKRIISLLLVFLSFSVGSALAAEAPYRHVVLFKFKDNAAPADVKKVEDAFLALEAKIPQIQDLEWGTNVSPEGLSNGFTHCFLVTFKSKSDLEIYLPHPDHKAFVSVLGPVVDKVLVFDYIAK